jgi:hypothetical protein
MLAVDYMQDARGCDEVRGAGNSFCALLPTVDRCRREKRNSRRRLNQPG